MHVVNDFYYATSQLISDFWAYSHALTIIIGCVIVGVLFTAFKK